MVIGLGLGSSESWIVDCRHGIPADRLLDLLTYLLTTCSVPVGHNIFKLCRRHSNAACLPMAASVQV